MARPALIYHSGYRLNLGEHVFPGLKYPEVYAEISRSHLIKHFDELKPNRASRKELSLVHSKEYIRDFCEARITYRTYLSELPLDEDIVNSVLLMCGGSILAAREALTRGRAINLAGGFHHSYPCHAEGFCYLNDVAVALNVMLATKMISGGCIIDLDLHQGNGTSYIYRDDPRVVTFSIHQEDVYPNKERSDIDIGLGRGIADAEYLEILEKGLEELSAFNVGELAMVVAGVDPLATDSLGHLMLSKDGIYKRDHMVLKWALKKKIAIAFTLGGGYSQRLLNTIDAHIGTLQAILDS